MTAGSRYRVPEARVFGDSRRDDEIQSRLRKAAGQLTGIAGMVEDGRYCTDVLDQLSAVAAAVDAVALLVLEDHINSCLRAATDDTHAAAQVAEVSDAIRRYVRSR